MIFQLTFLNCVKIPYPPSWCRYLIFAYGKELIPKAQNALKWCQFIKGVQRIYTPITDPSPSSHLNCKIFEKLFYSCLYTYLEQNNKLSSHQYGFRMGLSTTLVIYDMQENILENLEKGCITYTIFCDLSKAF